MFRPCIDLRDGRVTQIVGGTLAGDPSTVRVNYVSDRSPGWYADLYRADGLVGGHVVMLGPGNEAAAREALSAYPGGLQVGGGIQLANSKAWLDAGASHVIVTSWVFPGGRFDPDRLASLVKHIGRQRLVLDLSCRRQGKDYYVVSNRWQTLTPLRVDSSTLTQLAASCAEFLIHAVDIEGLCQGIDEDLVGRLAGAVPIPVTYAGGARSLDDLETVTRLGKRRIDLTIGSALDLFGGTGVRYADCVAFNRRLEADAGAGGTGPRIPVPVEP